VLATNTTAGQVGPLFLSHDADYDWLTAIEVRTDRRSPAGRALGAVSDSFGWLLCKAGGTDGLRD
jgi:hypothetical protein